jgi:hypothetical protein
MQTVRWVLICVILFPVPDAAAQPSEPIGAYAADIRGTFARFNTDPSVASSLDVSDSNLPAWGLGLVAGLHWYPLRLELVGFGIGGELLLARDSRTAEPTVAAPVGPTVTTRFSSLSPQVSVNFGKRDGWSYLSAGLGAARLTSERDHAPFAGEAERTRAINYGGGARWFTGRHLAFSVDLRFYTIDERPATSTQPRYPRSRMMVMSAGISLR